MFNRKLKFQLARTEAELAAARRSYRVVSDYRLAQFDELQAARAACGRLRKQRNAARNECVDLSNQVGDAFAATRTILANAVRLVDEATAEADEARAAATDLSDQVTAWKALAEGRSAEVRHQIEIGIDIRDRWAARARAAEDENRILAQDLDEARAAATELADRVAARDAQLWCQAANLRVAQAEVERRSKYEDEARRARERAEAQVESLTEQNAFLADELARLERTISVYAKAFGPAPKTRLPKGASVFQMLAPADADTDPYEYGIALYRRALADGVDVNDNDAVRTWHAYHEANGSLDCD